MRYSQNEEPPSNQDVRCINRKKKESYAAHTGVRLTRTVLDGWSMISASSSLDFDAWDSDDTFFAKEKLDRNDEVDVDAERHGVGASMLRRA